MTFGTTSGRGLESPLAPYLFGAIIVVTLVLWLWFHLDIRRMRREEEDREGEE